MSTQLRTTPLTVKDLAQILPKIAKGFPCDQGANLSISVNMPVPTLNFSISLAHTKQAQWEDDIASRMVSLSEVSFAVIQSFTIHNKLLSVSYSMDADNLGSITIQRFHSNQGHESDHSHSIELLKVVNQAIPLQTHIGILTQALPAAHRDQLTYQQQILAELQSTTEKITGGLTDFTLRAHTEHQARHDELERMFQTRRLDLDATVQQRQESLESAFRQRQTDLETAYQTKESELLARISAREEAVLLREQDVQKLKADLDLRDSTAARRANEKRIQAIIDAQSKIRLTDDTARKRRLVHLLCLLGVAAFGALSVTFLFRIMASSGDSFPWQFALPFSTGLIGFASTLVYWIKWSDDWFREHARAEFANRKFNADATRAAWLVELLLEWSREGRDAMPSAVVESLTKNLFTEVSGESPSHASDVLQRFVKGLTAVRVTADGVELDANKARIQQGHKA